MLMTDLIQKFIPEMDSPAKVYELFRGLKYPVEHILDPSYQRKIDEFDLAKEEKDKIKKIYTVLNVDKKLQVFLIEAKSLPRPFVRYITQKFAEWYLRTLLIFTTDYKNYSFVFPDYAKEDAGKHKLKVTRLNFDRENPYHTDLETITNLSFEAVAVQSTLFKGTEQTWRAIWSIWREAFNIRKVTDEFFEDYKNGFLRLKDLFIKQKFNIKDAHELTHQILNRIMFVYFIAKKRWLNDDPKFLKSFWTRYNEEKRKGKMLDNSFYDKWLRVLFLETFNRRFSHPAYLPDDIRSSLQMAPWLNGGLFRSNRLDELPVSISDNEFVQVFTFFEKYNFTIREDLPLDIEVAVDPQMIGYVYESLANVAEEIYERQDFGIFYTPRVEVDLMCRSSVVEYIANHIPELPKDKIYQLLFDEDKTEVERFITQKKLWNKIEEALDNLSVIDPACGSGAFLVGMLYVLAELYHICYRHLDRHMTDYELKKKIIGNSLYGVDVMPWAVRSAELRLWLQLMIESDLKITDLQRSPLLPNLDLNLRIGDSLVQEIGGINLHLKDSNISPSIKGKLTALKKEKEKYYNGELTGKFKDPKLLLNEEIRIFGEIIDERILSLSKEKQELRKSSQLLNQGTLYHDINAEKKEQEKQRIESRSQEMDEEINNLQRIKKGLKDPEHKPFVWDIDFAEIFGDKGGFDIAIGNPPYVRQEKIAPPNKLKGEITAEIKRDYKEKLLASVQSKFSFIKTLNKQSDYYIYFYFHGLSLLNDKGTFCFITSNSWLDVGYGSDLQEFLIKYVPIKAIYDSQSKRSFEHADVNTIIALFGAPKIEDKNGRRWIQLNNTARFVMFKKPFEEVITTKNLLLIEQCGSSELFFKRKTTDDFRCLPIKQETLLEEGWEYPEETDLIPNIKFSVKGGPTSGGQKDKFVRGEYTGNKWGGKYLRAPEIFFTILEKGKDKLVKLGDIADVKRGFTTGVNEFFYLDKDKIKEWQIESEFLKPIVKSPRECKSILINPKELINKVFMCHKSKSELKGTNALKYIEWGEKQKYHKRPSCSGRDKWWDLGNRKGARLNFNYLINDIGDTYIGEAFFSDNFQEIHTEKNLEVFLNSSVSWLFQNLSGRTSFGGGLLKIQTYELERILVLEIVKNNFLVLKRETKSVFEEIGINPDKLIREQEPRPLPDRKELDDTIFNILDLTNQERKEVYWAVAELVQNRLNKARSV